MIKDVTYWKFFFFSCSEINCIWNALKSMHMRRTAPIVSTPDRHAFIDSVCQWACKHTQTLGTQLMNVRSLGVGMASVILFSFPNSQADRDPWELQSGCKTRVASSMHPLHTISKLWKGVVLEFSLAVLAKLESKKRCLLLERVYSAAVLTKSVVVVAFFNQDSFQCLLEVWKDKCLGTA